MIIIVPPYIIFYLLHLQVKKHLIPFISNRSAQVAEGIAKGMGLLTAREVQQLRLKQRQVKHPEMEHIKELAKATLAQPETRSVAKFISLFNEAGAKDDFRVEAYHNKQGNFQGLRFYSGEDKFKASEIDKSHSKKKISSTR